MRADADVRGLLHVGGLADGEGLPLEGVRLRPGAALRLAGGGPAAAERALLRTGGYLVRGRARVRVGARARVKARARVRARVRVRVRVRARARVRARVRVG